MSAVVENGNVLAGVRGNYIPNVYAPIPKEISDKLGGVYAQLGFDYMLMRDEDLNRQMSAYGASFKTLERGLRRHGLTGDDFAELRGTKKPVKGVIDVYLIPASPQEYDEVTVTFVGAIPFEVDSELVIEGKAREVASNSQKLTEILERHMKNSFGI